MWVVHALLRCDGPSLQFRKQTQKKTISKAIQTNQTQFKRNNKLHKNIKMFKLLKRKHEAQPKFKNVKTQTSSSNTIRNKKYIYIYIYINAKAYSKIIAKKTRRTIQRKKNKFKKSSKSLKTKQLNTLPRPESDRTIPARDCIK